jgi:hypothetical protein
VGLLTPDDVVLLHPDLQAARESASERSIGMQSRPNVLLEIGMALGIHEDRTILVEIGEMRPVTDLAGRHAVRMDGSPKQTNALKSRLETAGCTVNTSNPAWARSERWTRLTANRRGADSDRLESHFLMGGDMGSRSADVGGATRVARMTRDFEWLQMHIGHLVFASLDDPECYVQFAREDKSGPLWMEVSSGKYHRPRTLKLSQEARAQLVERGLDRPRRAENTSKNFGGEKRGTPAELARVTEAIFHDVFGLPETFPLQVSYSE